ncbi:hypothetical protein [Wenyingzhuangia sp. IMCC45574]
MKKFIVLGLLLCFGLTSMAQQKNNQKVDYKQINALRRSYITEKLSLQPEQSKKFWPIYNKYRKETAELYKSKNTLQKTIKFKQISEQEASNILTTLFTKEKEIINLKVALSKDLSTILRPKQILKLKLTEINFKKKLLEHIKKKTKKQQN